MKKFFIPCLLMLCIFFSANSVKAYPTLQDNPNVAVLPFRQKAAVAKILGNVLDFRDATIISNFTIDALLPTGLFHFVDYEDAESVANVHITNSSGLVNTSNAAQIGKQLTPHYLIGGSLTGLDAKKSDASGKSDLIPGTKIGADIGGSKRKVIANIVLKITNVETNEIILSAQGVGESSVANAVFTINQRGEEVYETDTTDDGTSSPTVGESTSVNVFSHTFKIGTEEYSGIQVQNAIQKAVADAIYNKNYGLIAKMNGTAKGGRFYK